MLVLEATSEQQGDQEDDYHWCTDGELVYQQPDMGCRTPDCGCERGWAGFDSHRSTTSVKVVDRPGFTVADLAQELAVSLHDGGWLTQADPGDHVVAEIVADIIECANHFGSGAVLARDGNLIWRRGTIPMPQEFEIRSEDLDRLSYKFTQRHPMKALEWAAQCVSVFGYRELELRQRLRADGWFDGSVLAKAMEWLATQQSPDSLMDPDTPRWLHRLDSGSIRAARYRHEDEVTAYLLEVKLPGGPVGTLYLKVDASGRLCDASSFGGPTSKLGPQLRSTDNDRFGKFKPMSTKMAQRSLRASVEAFDRAPVQGRPTDSWPSNRPLVDFVLDELAAR